MLAFRKSWKIWVANQHHGLWVQRPNWITSTRLSLDIVSTYQWLPALLIWHQTNAIVLSCFSQDRQTQVSGVPINQKICELPAADLDFPFSKTVLDIDVIFGVYCKEHFNGRLTTLLAAEQQGLWNVIEEVKTLQVVVKKWSTAQKHENRKTLRWMLGGWLDLE